MKITDRILLDFLDKNPGKVMVAMPPRGQHEWAYDSGNKIFLTKKNLRQAIDAAIRASKAGRRAK